MEDIDQVEEYIKKLYSQQDKLLTYACKVRKKISPKDNTDEEAEFLAHICVALDQRFDGEPLTLEWMLDHYVAFELEQTIYPKFIVIWEKLSQRKCTYKNPFEYFSGLAYPIPHPTKRVYVSRVDSCHDKSYLIVDEGTNHDNYLSWHHFLVRNVWDHAVKNSVGYMKRPTLQFYRKRKFDFTYGDDGIYGDCRDPGHVLTYAKTLLTHGKADHVEWDLQAPLAWFRETRRLFNALQD